MSEVTRQDLERLESKVDLIGQSVAEIKALQQTEAQRCPYREQIARAQNGQAHRDALERRIEEQGKAISVLANLPKLEEQVAEHDDQIHAMQLSLVKLLALMIGAGALGGALSGPLGGILSAIGG